MPTLDELVAQPNTAPQAWQSKPPDSWSRKPPVTMTPELRRVLELPRRERPGAETLEAMIELMTDRFRRHGVQTCRCAQMGRPCITRLRGAQAWALYEAGIRRGLLAPIGVGHGKTLIDILIALALQVSKVLLLVPAPLVSQLVREYDLVREHWLVPSLVVHGKNETRQSNDSDSVLHVMSYSRLSREDATTFLEEYQFDAIVGDEIHKLKCPDSVRTSRVLRHYAAHPDTIFCGWSGSITDKSLKDYAHLAMLALDEGSPLPREPEVVEEWALAIDPSDWQAPAGELFRLCEPGEHVASGFHRRLVSTMGIVATEDAAISADLQIEERAVDAIPVEIDRLINQVRSLQMRPDEEILVDAFSQARCARELACGFYYRWRFPRGEPIPLIMDWLDARKEWRSELRDKLKDRAEYLDSPKLCRNAAERFHGDLPLREDRPVWDAGTWPRWRDIRNEVKPETEAVWVDDYLVKNAAEWAVSNCGIVWYESDAFGRAIAQVSGLPLHSGGPGAGARIAAEKGDRSIICSIKSHGTGRDGLQYLFNTQLVAQPPSSPTAWEQLLGRLHRVGQAEAIVYALFYRHTDEVRAAVEQALLRAEYVESTIGSVQKLRVGWRG